MLLDLTEWFLFYLTIVIICLLERVVTYSNVYTKLEVKSEGIRAVFLKRQNLIFSIVAGSI